MKKITLLLALLVNCLLLAQDFSVDGISYTITSSVDPYTVEATDYDERSTDVVIPRTVTNSSMTYTVTSIGSQAFTNNSLISVTIPDSIIVIGQYAFVNNSLTSIIIPSSVTTIIFSAFRNNPLTSVISESLNPATLPTWAFGSNGYSNIDLYIPVGATAAYTAADWTGFKSITEDAALSVNNNMVLKNVSFTLNTKSNTIKVVTTNAVRFKSISLYNISGQRVLESKKIETSIANLPNSVYIAYLTTNIGSVTKKFLK